MNPVIASLAILKVNYDEMHKDYVENFVPFFAECIRLSENDIVSTPDLQDDLRNRFGLVIPLQLRQSLSV